MTQQQMIQVDACAELRLPFGVSLQTCDTWLIALAIVAATSVAIVLGLRMVRWWAARNLP